VGTSTIAYNTYTRTPSHEPPLSVSDTNCSPRIGFNLAKAILEGRSSENPRASDRDEVGHDSLQAVQPALREPARDWKREELGICATSRKLRSQGVGSSPSPYRPGENFYPNKFLSSHRKESSSFAVDQGEAQTSRYPHSPQHEHSPFGTYREVSAPPCIPRTSGFRGIMPPRMSPLKIEVNRLPSPFGPNSYQDPRAMEDDLCHDDESVGQSEGQLYRFSPQPQNTNTESPFTTRRLAALSRPTTPSCPPLLGSRIRKCSQYATVAIHRPNEHISQASVLTKGRVGFKLPVPREDGE
jgi:hypothetical protein